MSNIRQIKAITLHEPYATFIRDGHKHYETRSWSTNYRGLLAIHAAQKWVNNEQGVFVQSLASGLPHYRDYLERTGAEGWHCGCVVCIMRLVDVHRAEAVCDGLSESEYAVGDYGDGRYAWQLEPVMMDFEPIPVTGQQGLWDWDAPGGLFAHHVAIVGSRSFEGNPTIHAAIRERIQALPDETTVVSGGAAGVDHTAEKLAAAYGHDVISLPVPSHWWDEDVFGKGAGYRRNREIIALSSKVVAFTAGTPGTADTIQRARKAGLPVIVNPHDIPDDRHSFEDAKAIAVELARMIDDACDKLVIGGSIRRQTSHVGDCELIAIPTSDATQIQENRLIALTDKLAASGTIERGGSWGDKHRKIRFKGMKFDLFCADEWNWGYVKQLRTGSADFNQQIMIHAADAPFTIGGERGSGYIWYGEEKLYLPDERDWFDLLGLPYLTPYERTGGWAQKLFREDDHRWGNPADYVRELKQRKLPLGAYDEGALIDELAKNNRISADASPDRPPFEWRYPWKVADDYVWVPDGWETYEDIQTEEERRGRTYKCVPIDSDEAQRAPDSLGLRTLYMSATRELYRWLDYQAGWQPVPVEIFDCGDLPYHYAVRSEDTTRKTLSLDDITLTQHVYHRSIVRHYDQTLWVRDANGDLPHVVQFRDTPPLLMDGTHRWMSCRKRGRQWLPVMVDAYDMTFREACGLLPDDSDMLPTYVEILEEAMNILAEPDMAPVT